MSVAIINPNSSASMTEAMVSAASRAMPELRFEGWTSQDGPPAIQGRQDGAVATPPLLELVQQVSSRGAEAILIGCFDDTGLQEAAKRAACPVLGIGQASYHFAALNQWRFSVVTTLSVSIPVLEENIRLRGPATYLARVRASEVPVLELERAPAVAAEQIIAECRIAIAEDDVDAIVLGCAGMVQVTETVGRALPVPVIDPVTCAARCAGWVLRAS